MHIQVIQGAPNLLVVTMILLIVGKVNVIFLDFPDKVLGIAILSGFAHISHVKLGLGVLKELGIDRGHKLVPSVRTVNLWNRIPGVFVCHREIDRAGFYDHVSALADRLYGGTTNLIQMIGIFVIVLGTGARFGLYFGATEPAIGCREAVRTDRERVVKLLRSCAERGLYVHDYAHKTLM